MKCKKSLAMLLLFIFLMPAQCLAGVYSNRVVNFTVNLPETWIPVEYNTVEQDVVFLRHFPGGYDSSLTIKAQEVDSSTPYTLDDLSDKQMKGLVNSAFNSTEDITKTLIENKVSQVAGHKALYFVTRTAADDTKVDTVWVLFLLKNVFYTISVTTNSNTYDKVVFDLQQMLKTFRPYELPAEVV